MTEKKPPYVPKELLEHLEHIYPDKCPDPDKDSNREVWVNAGRADVVRKLRWLYEKQLEK